MVIGFAKLIGGRWFWRGGGGEELGDGSRSLAGTWVVFCHLQMGFTIVLYHLCQRD
jgi:hypothetical protein